MYACTYVNKGSLKPEFSCDVDGEHLTLYLVSRDAYIYMDREAAQELHLVLTDALATESNEEPDNISEITTA